MFERLDSERDGSAVLAVLRRRWWIIILVAAIGAGGAYFFANRKPKQYTAQASLLFTSPQFDQTLFGKQVNSASPDPGRQAATNLALLDLQTVARRVSDVLKIPRSQVVSDIQVGSDSQSDVVSVTATDSGPATAASIANTYVQQYIAFRQQTDRNQLAQAQRLVNSQIAAFPPSKQNSSTYLTLLSESHQLQLLASLQTGNAEVVQTATAPRSPSAPSPKKDAIIGLILGLLAAAGLVALLERGDRRIKVASEVEGLYGAPVLGMVPESGSLRRTAGDGSSREQEAFRMLRAQMRYFDVDRDINRVLITSADIGEGKTTIGLNLARASGSAGDTRVLLIEADLRRPALARMLGMSRVAGLSELLSQSHDIAQGLHELVVTHEAGDERKSAGGHDILLAGATPPNPVELLESQRMAELLDYADSIYDLVILDTPPIGLVSDPVSLIHRVDGVLVVSRLRHSRRDHAARLMKQLRALNANILGVVVNSSAAGIGAKYGYYEYAESNGKSPRRKWSGRQRQGSDVS